MGRRRIWHGRHCREERECFPPCVYAAYNEIRVADKAILHAVDSGHGMPDKVIGPLGAWLKE